jgi:hypothetical protein
MRSAIIIRGIIKKKNALEKETWPTIIMGIIRKYKQQTNIYASTNTFKNL